MPKLPDRIVWAVELLDVGPDDRILEVGCGNGVAVSLIAPRLRSGVVTAIDRSAKAVDRASTVNRERILSGRARVLQETLQDLPGDGEGYQKVFAVNVNPFWLHPERELPATWHHLVPGGRLLLVLEAPSVQRTRTFVEDMPGYLEAHGFEGVTASFRTDTLACVSARRPL